MNIDRPGIYRDFPEADYFADPCPQPSLTQSIAKVLIDQSELHARFQHPKLAPSSETDEPEKYDAAKAIGNAVHAVMIGRGREIAVAPFDSWRTDKAKAFREKTETAGKLVVLEKHMLVAHEMTLAAKLQINNVAAVEPALLDAFVNGAGEVVAVAEVDGIWLRTLIDWMASPTVLFDFKSTGRSVAPHAIPYLMAEAGWPVQAAMQERILDLIEPDTAGRRRFFFIAQENYKPYALTVHELTEAVLTTGRDMLGHAEKLWRNAMKTSTWRGYAPVVHQPQFPGWRETEWYERRSTHEAVERAIDPKLLMAG